MGLYGAGFQAASMIQAMCAIRPIDQVKVYSPTPDRRKQFCKTMSDRQGIEVIPVESPAEAAQNADIVACATNVVTQGAVCKADWIQPGTFATSIKFREFDERTFERAAKIFQTGLTADLLHEYILHTPPGMRVPERSARAEGGDRELYQRCSDKLYPLENLLTGDADRRDSASEIMMFLKGVGTGIEFTAAAKRAYDLAKAQGRGRELPTEWLMQVTHAAWRPH